MITPVYGFLEGDTLGILMLIDEYQRVEDIISKLQELARVRVSTTVPMGLRHQGKVIDNRLTLSDAGIGALDRIDVFRTGADHG